MIQSTVCVGVHLFHLSHFMGFIQCTVSANACEIIAQPMSNFLHFLTFSVCMMIDDSTHSADDDASHKFYIKNFSHSVDKRQTQFSPNIFYGTEFLLGKCQKAHIMLTMTMMMMVVVLLYVHVPDVYSPKSNYPLCWVRFCFDFSGSKLNPLMWPIRTSSFHNVPDVMKKHVDSME